MRRFYFCSADGLTCLRTEVLKDTMLVMTNIGKREAQDLQGSTKATLLVPGKTGSTGDVTYTARHGGTGPNSFFIEHEVGDTGPEHLSRPLAVSVDTEDEDGVRIVVTFGTTGAGATITPTAQEVATVVNAASYLQELVSASPGGTGDAGFVTPTYLEGGLDDGDWRKFNVSGGNCLRVNTVEVI